MSQIPDGTSPASAVPPSLPTPSVGPSPRKKSGGGWKVGCGILVGLGVLFIIGLIGISFVSGFQDGSADKIVQIDLDGVISSASPATWTGTGKSMVDRISEQLTRANEDPSVKAIVLRVNSPGGEVTASDVLYHRVKQVDKPIVIYMDSVAASGGYYIACAGDEIMANQTTLTGSIGVIIQTLNYTDLFNKIGMDSVAFTSGRYKDTLSGGRPMRPDEEELIQGMVDDIYERFLEVVKEGRPKLAEPDLRKNIADGRIFTGKTAKEVGLIDSLGYLENAWDRARELGGVPDAPVINYNEDLSFLDALTAVKVQAVEGAAAGNQPQRLEVDLLQTGAPVLKPGMIYYLPAHFAR